jgi:hypothetical protein
VNKRKTGQFIGSVENRKKLKKYCNYYPQRENCRYCIQNIRKRSYRKEAIREQH